MCGTIASISLPNFGGCIGQWDFIDAIKTQVSINWQIFPLANIFLVGFQPNIVERGYWYAFSIRLSLETPLVEIVYALQWPANDSQLSWNIFSITETNVTIMDRIPFIISQFQSWITSGLLVVQPTLNVSGIMSFFNGNQCFYIVYMRGQFYGDQSLPPDQIILNKSLCISCQVNIMSTINLDNTTYTTITSTLPSLSSVTGVSTIGSTATPVFNLLWSGRITNMLWSNDCSNLTSSCSQNLTSSLQKVFCSLTSNGSASSFICNQFTLNWLKPGSIIFSSTANVSSQLPQNSLVASLNNVLATMNSSSGNLLQFDPASNNLTIANSVQITTSSESITNVDNATVASRASTLAATISSPGISTNTNGFPTGGTVGNSGSSTVVSTNITEAVTSASIGNIYSSTAGSLATSQSQSGGTVGNSGSSTVGSLATSQSQSGGTVGNSGSSTAVTQLSSASSLSNSTANSGISMSASIANSYASTVVSTTTNGLSSVSLTTSNGYSTTTLTANSSSSSVFNLLWSGRITNILWSNDCSNLTSSCSQNLTSSLQKVFCSLTSNGSASSFTCNQFTLNWLKPGSIIFSSTANVSSQLTQNSLVASLNNVLATMNSSSGNLLQFDPASNNLTIANSVQVTTNSTTATTAAAPLTTTSPGNQNSDDSSWRLIVGCVVGIGGFLILLTIILSVYICNKYRRQRSVPFNRETQGKLKSKADVYKSLEYQHPTMGSESPDIILSTAF
ncbi:unnamed protein product [Rotaria magnacalcarata]|uniref:Uncharacterized protein n=2 Tax=Rotaria magnacalcarata TaxID=392030 RepID=A0A816TYY2_9BILA|nr:unnamed protein product [Rotaria magnacalcarata]